MSSGIWEIGAGKHKSAGLSDHYFLFGAGWKKTIVIPGKSCYDKNRIVPPDIPYD